MIYFDFVCTFPFQQLYVQSNYDGVIVQITKHSGERVNLEDLKFRDRMILRERLSDWVQYHKDMEEMYKTEPPEDHIARTVET